MKELAKHIEVLLLENDCVIVPGLGGFIAHNKPAEFKVSANIFCPPMRNIGFNPQLTINDGLLVQSYMQTYNTDFPDATRIIENVVSEIKEALYKNGQVELYNVGTLYYTMNGMYGFEPWSKSFHTPYLYGLGNFTISPLSEIVSDVKNKNTEQRIIIETVLPIDKDKKERQDSDSFIKKLAKQTIGIAAALILFFVLSVPVENTYLDNANYASLGAETMFDAIRSKSLVVNNISDSEQTANKKRIMNNVNTLQPVAVRSVKVEKPAKEVKAVKKTPEIKNTEKSVSANVPAKKTSFIIVSSLTSMKDAERELKKYHSQGYSDAQIVVSGERYRVALFSFNDKVQANRKANELRKEERFKTVWVFNKTK